MKLFYIANVRMPTEKAHGIQIMEMCQAFAQSGAEVELVVPNRKTPIKEDPFSFYGVKDNFKIKKLWCLDWVTFGWLGFWIQTLTFGKMVFWFALFKSGQFYTRDESLALALKILGKRVSWEAHMGQKNIFVRLLLKTDIKVVVISEGLKDLYQSMGFKNILVAPDGADIDRFDIDLSKSDARSRLNLPLDKKIILYKGSLGKWKGADTLAQAAPLVSNKDAICVFIGGSEEDVSNFKREFANPKVLILGNRPRQETPIYQKAADILIIPNSAKEDISKLYTSPMKLFGYMAGGRPIIASDLPSLREILGESQAYFFEPDNPQSLADKIDTVLGHMDEAENKAEKALAEVRQYSWTRRAKMILEFIA